MICCVLMTLLTLDQFCGYDAGVVQQGFNPMSDSYSQIHSVIDQLELCESGTTESNRLLLELGILIGEKNKETDRTIAKAHSAWSKLEGSLDQLDELCTAL